MDSMMRPSRGLRESATTTRKFGCFFLPTRINLILTMVLLRLRFWGKKRVYQGLAHARRHLEAGREAHLSALAPRHLLHHLPDLIELFDELVHVPDRRTRAR